MKNFDEINKKIIFELSRNSRQNISELSKNTKIRRETINYRIKQLESSGIINNYYTIIDHNKLGYIMIRLYIKLQNINSEIEEKIIKYLFTLKDITVICTSEGDWDLIVCILTKTYDLFYITKRELKEKFGSYINKINASLLYKYSRLDRKYLINNLNLYKNELYTISNNNKKVEIKKMDIKLLNIISENAKINIVDIAKQLKITPKAVKYKIKRLEKDKIIVGYSANIDMSKFGYEYYKIDLILGNTIIIEDLSKFIKSNLYVIYIDWSIGGSDFEFEIEVQGIDSFYNFMKNLKDRFGNEIITYKFYKRKKLYKYKFIPIIDEL